MSKNLARKGFAFGALVALAATAITGAPASADTTGPITLVPNAGTTFNSILQSGITLKSEIDPSVSATDAATLSFLVTNADAKAITINFTGADAIGESSTQLQSNSADAADGTVKVGARTTVGVAVAESSAKYQYVTGFSKDATDRNAATSGGANTLAISTSVTDANVTLKVRAWLDADRDGVVDTFEQSSDEETVILYSLANVSATTTLTDLAVGSDKVYKGTVVFGNDINPFAVADRVGTKLLKDGSVVDISGSASSLDATEEIAFSTASTSAIAAAAPKLGQSKNVLTFGSIAGTTTLTTANIATGFYTAQTYYKTGGSWAAANISLVGAPSAAFDLTAGANASVTNVKATFIDTADAKFNSVDAADLIVRSESKSVTLGAQIVSGDVNLDAAGVEVKAVLSATALDATSTVTVTGSTGSLVKDGAAITSIARTDANGKVSFVITSTTGKSADAVDVELYVKTSTGAWVKQVTHLNQIDIVWQKAQFATFTAKGGNYVSGANPTVTVQIKDQFGQGLDAIGGNKLSASAVAVIGGLSDSTKYNATAAFSGGKASFTFANFAAVNGVAQLKVSYYKNGTDASQGTLYVNVYNAPATKEISVASSFKTNITYKDFVTGDKGDAAVAKKISDAGIAGTVDITGTVLNVNNVGQNGLPVTVSFPGALLIDGDTYAADKIETKTNEYGYFTVSVAVHTVNTKGATVTISADGKTATTLVKSYLPSDLGAANLAFSWSLPAFLVKDTTYAATLKLTDKWGNAVKTTSKTQQGVTVSATGALQVNGVSTDVERNFDKNGQVTIYLRSVSKIAGPAEVTATLNTDAAYAVSADATDSLDALDAITTDVTTTVWDETKFSDELSAEVVVRDLAPKATITKATNSSVVVKNASGLTIKVVRGSKVTTKVATSDSQKITLKGGKGTVKVYVNGVKVASK